VPDRPRPVADSPAGGSSPVPEEYGALGGPLPPAPEEAEQRQRRPFRWRTSRDEEAAAPPEVPRTPVAYARTTDAQPAGEPAPGAPPGRTAAPPGEGRRRQAARTEPAGDVPTGTRPRPAARTEPAAPPGPVTPAERPATAERTPAAGRPAEPSPAAVRPAAAGTPAAAEAPTPAASPGPVERQLGARPTSAPAAAATPEPAARPPAVPPAGAPPAERTPAPGAASPEPVAEPGGGRAPRPDARAAGAQPAVAAEPARSDARRPDSRSRAAGAGRAAGAEPAGPAPAAGPVTPRQGTRAVGAAPSSRAPVATDAPTAAVPVVAPDDAGDAGDQERRRFRIVPAGVPKDRVDERGRVRRPAVTDPPEPEARPAAYLKETVRTRQVIRHFDLASVLRVSLMFYALGLLSVTLAGVVLWNVASTLGIITSIDKSIRTLFDLKSFTLHPLSVLGYGLAAGLVLVIAGALINVLIAMFFNLISDVTGGLVVRVVAEPDDR
jgi:hypothetical protein